MEISILVLPPLIAGLCTLVLGLYILLKNQFSGLNRSLALLFFCITLWQFGNAASWSAKTTLICRITQQLLYLGVTFISAAAYHFSIEFNNLQKQKKWISLVYFFNALLLLLVVREDFLVGFRQMPWGKHALVGLSHNIYLFLWAIPVIFALFNFYYGYKKAVSLFERQRRRFALLCFFVACLAGIDYLPNYGLSVVYPFGFIFLLIFCAAVSYAILQYSLLDVKIILKKASIITFLCTIAAISIYITPFYVRPYLYDILGTRWIFFPISVAFLCGLGLFRLINFVRRMEEAELSKRFVYRPILKKEAERASAARSIEEFLVYLTRDLSSWVGLDYVGILVWDNHKKEFVLLSSHARSKEVKKIPKGLAFSQDCALIVELLRKRKPLIYSEIKYYLDTQSVRPDDQPFINEVITQMKGLSAEISVPCFCEGKLLAVVNIGHKLNLNEAVTHEDLELFHSLSNSIARAIYDFMLKQEKAELIVASQHILITAIEAKDFYTRGHTDRVARYCNLIGNGLEKELRLFHHGLANLNWAAQLHDLGKISIPDKILFKKDVLSEEEWQIVKRHTLVGVRILEPMREWLSEDIYSGVQHHHENYDGSGYPSGQKGEEIHLFSRVIRVADAFDAMTTDRPYRAALTKEKAIGELRQYKNSYFDPRVVDAAIKLYDSGDI